MKKEINVFEYANEILQGVKKGALVTTKNGDFVNTMTISWGTLGIEWGKPIFTTFVREHRYTKGMLDVNPEFTVCIPTEDSDKTIGGFCGTKSGRDVDKIKELNLTLVDSDEISVLAIKEYPIILECRAIYKQAQDPEAIPQAIRDREYPQDVDSSCPLSNKDFHTAYYGEIVKAYIICED